MPLHEYRCDSCDHTEDHLTSHEDRDKPRACPACGEAMERVKFSRSSFILSGGGWYKDGYQKKQ